MQRYFVMYMKEDTVYQMLMNIYLVFPRIILDTNKQVYIAFNTLPIKAYKVARTHLGEKE